MFFLEICFPECTTVFREEMISNNTSRKLHSEINKLVSRLQKLELSQDVKVINYEGSYKLIAVMTYGYLEATRDIFDVKSIAHRFTVAEKIRGKSNGSESAERLCEMMFNDDVVTTRRSVIMRLATEVLEHFTGSNIYPKVREKICAAASKTHKHALFVQPKAESCDICTRPFCVNINTSQVKIYCNKTI